MQELFAVPIFYGSTCSKIQYGLLDDPKYGLACIGHILYATIQHVAVSIRCKVPSPSRVLVRNALLDIGLFAAVDCFNSFIDLFTKHEKQTYPYSSSCAQWPLARRIYNWFPHNRLLFSNKAKETKSYDGSNILSLNSSSQFKISALRNTKNGWKTAEIQAKQVCEEVCLQTWHAY